MDRGYLAKEAERLLRDQVLIHAIEQVCAEATEALTTADADDKTNILRLQQRVQATQAILDRLQSFVDDVDAQNHSPSI